MKEKFIILPALRIPLVQKVFFYDRLVELTSFKAKQSMEDAMLSEKYKHDCNIVEKSGEAVTMCTKTNTAVSRVLAHRCNAFK